jgi:hypothetical protein
MLDGIAVDYVVHSAQGAELGDADALAPLRVAPRARV